MIRVGLMLLSVLLVAGSATAQVASTFENLTVDATSGEALIDSLVP